MEVTFQNQGHACLNPVLRQVMSTEQSQEVRLTEEMPDVGSILAAWGQPVLRSKEWSADTLRASGGMMVWVLYTPEDGSAVRCLDTWIPFQMSWDLPEDLPEGKACLGILPKSVEARSISPRKIQVRSAVSIQVQAFVPMELPVSVPQSLPEDVELLRTTYPVRLFREAGEKSFPQEETLTLPESAPIPEEVICYRAQSRVTDRKVLSRKLVFRGNTGVHLCYRCREGQLHSWDFDLPFSQYADLEGEYGPDAQADFTFCPTTLELELDGEGQLRLSCNLAAQYVITDREQLELVADAYSLNRELEVRMDTLEIPAILDSRRESLYAEQVLPGQGSLAVDTWFLPEYPRQSRTDSGVALGTNGVFQSLYYGEDQSVHSGVVRWEGTLPVTAEGNVEIWAVPAVTGVPQTAMGSGMTVKAELALDLTAAAVEQLPMVTGLTVGEAKKPEPGRPSLILSRAGEESLWEIAKAANSTVCAIREANDLQGEPVPGQLLLIPIS